MPVSVLFSEPKIPQLSLLMSTTGCATRVSVLFSEPKIPQQSACGLGCCVGYRVSVLFSEPKIPQPARIEHVYPLVDVSVLFSEPKIPQPWQVGANPFELVSFSALQRAENSSTSRAVPLHCAAQAFQCSSASRKFLNSNRQCNSLHATGVSVLFSEPKIPQLIDAPPILVR